MKNKHKKTNTKRILLQLTLVASIVMVPLSVSAATDSDATVVNVNLGSSISVSTSGTVTMNVTPAGSGSMSSASDTVTVATNNSTGYALTLANADADTDLQNGGNAIAADSGTQASPSSSLTNNRWGYRVDGLGGFGAGATSVEDNVENSDYSWAGVPASGSASTIRTTSSESASSVTTVWYGIKADTTNPNGTYTDTVTYTVTSNP